MSSVSWQTAPNGATQENNGPRAKCDQVIFEAMAKASEIIVNGRSAGGQSAQLLPSGSSRFNLMVPESKGVRQILQRWRRALHVPLRLDLYYQSCSDHEQRELLERWCLEYTPVSQDLFTERELSTSQDPIVQLRHVCKKIVIWLRNMYCSSRLLPAQAFQHPSCGATRIGFSIYVLSHGNDDVTDLVANQGFLCQNQPSSVLTPYGELAWKVYHSSKGDIERRLPPNHPHKAPLWMPREPSVARPISRPVAIPRNSSDTNIMDQYQQQQPIISSTATRREIAIPQSAPAVANYFPSRDGLLDRNQHEKYGSPLPQPRNTYHAPRHFIHRSNSDHHDNGNQNGHALLRRNTSLGIEGVAHKVREEIGSEDMEHPERLLSGLSLALMTQQDKNSGTDHVNFTNDEGITTADHSQVEKRRVALHHAPPHLMDQHKLAAAAAHQGTTPTFVQQNPDHISDNTRSHNLPTSAGEYGYAYNNHISWNQIRPSTTVPISLPEQDASAEEQDTDGRIVGQNNSPSRPRLGSSPSPLVGTPPSGALFVRAGTGYPTMMSPGSFIPPRNAAAPPFPSRPIGFAQEAPQLSPQQTSLQQQSQQRDDAMNEMIHRSGPPMMTSLDLLHSSPFQQGASAISTLSMGAGAQTSSLRPVGLHSGSAVQPSPSRDVGDESDGLEYDMPFAVDDSLPVMDTDINKNGSRQADSHHVACGSGFADSSLGASSAVASFAQKCAPAQHRLKLFESMHGTEAALDQSRMATSELTSQLAEFHSFGASLSLPSSHAQRGSNSGSDEGGGGSSLTPIPLRTG